MIKVAAVAALILMASPAFSDSNIQALDDDFLSQVSGQEGVALDLEMRLNTDAQAQPLSNLGSCAGLANACHIAIQLNNRNSGSGEWLVIKDLYGKLNLSNLYLDHSDLAGTSSYLDTARFRDKAGSCLITACNPNGLPALALSFPGSANTFEADLNLFLSVGRMAVEYGATGYNADLNGSFVGLKISDVRAGQIQAAADIDGKVRVYGF